MFLPSNKKKKKDKLKSLEVKIIKVKGFLSFRNSIVLWEANKASSARWADIHRLLQAYVSTQDACISFI